MKIRDRVSGLVYLKERKVLGLGAGILYGDATLGAMVLAAEAERERILASALEAVLERRRIWALRILVPSAGHELDVLKSAAAAAGVEVGYRAAENHASIALPDDYQSFVAALGPKSRRNLRYYRRRFEQAGHQYVPRMSAEEFALVSRQLSKKGVTGSGDDGLDRALKMLTTIERPLFAGLRHRDGQWLSTLGGWYNEDGATVFMQLNDDRDHAADSLSLVMRGYLVEELIAGDFRSLLFWAGVGGPLGQLAEPVPTLRVFLDKRDALGRSLRWLLKSAAPLLPRKIQWIAEWIHAGAGDP